MNSRHEFAEAKGKDSAKWLPKSPKLHGSHNWNSQGSHWVSLKGKESAQGGGLCKFSSVKENGKEGRISPEQEAEGLEDPCEDEPISKFSGSLFASSDSIRDQKNAGAALRQERQEVATKPKCFPATKNEQQVSSAATHSFPAEGKKFSEAHKDRIPGGTELPLWKGILTAPVSKDGPGDLAQAQSEEKVLEDTLISKPNTPDSCPAETPSKSGSFQAINHVITIPQITLTRSSTSDEDTDQFTEAPDDSEPEEMENTEGHIYSDSLNNAFYVSQ